MKEKFRQTSIFSTFKRKLDIFKWQVKKPNREEPILLGIKSTRTNCEVSDDFEYFDPRVKPRQNLEDTVSGDIYCSLDNENNVITSVPTALEKYKNSDKSDLVTINNKKPTRKENEIEIFERKFLAPLSSSRSSTTIVINDAQDSVKLRSDAGIRRQTMIPTPSSSSNTVSVSRVSPVSSSSSSSGLHHQHPHHVRVLRTSSKDSDCDSGAYSRSSSPEPIYERLDRSCEKLTEKLPLQSPNLVLSVIKENYKSKINSNLLLSCLNEAGKSSIFCSLDNLNQIPSSSQPQNQRYVHMFKKNAALRKLSADPSVTVTVGSHTHLSIGLGVGSSKSETELNKIYDRQDLLKCFQRSQKKYLKSQKYLKSETERIKNCDCQVTVNGQHICNNFL